MEEQIVKWLDLRQKALAQFACFLPITNLFE
jgi:hypothetical protein